MKTKVFFVLLTVFSLMFATAVNADEVSGIVDSIQKPESILSVDYSDEYEMHSDFLGATPRPDGDAALMQAVAEEDAAFTIEAYNNFIKADPDLFLYDDDRLPEYDRYSDMTEDELKFVQQKAEEITGDCKDADEKIRAVAEYVALNTCYDYDYINHDKPESELYTSAYDVLVNGSSVCHGYALSCMVLLQSVDIPCVFVRSPEHAWNLAYNGERWILFDSTWMSTGRLEYGVLDKGETIRDEWFDYTIDVAAGEFNHTIEELDFTIVGNELIKFPSLTLVDSYEIPEGITSIGTWAFENCVSLDRVTFPEGLTDIGDSAFCGCEGIDEIIIPDSVVNIEFQAFANCYDLDYIKIGNGVTNIGNNAFANCSDIENIVIGNKVTSLGHWYFGEKLESAEMGDGITAIEDYTFLQCSNLKNVVMGKNVQSIGYASFAYCTALESIELHDSLISIGESAFLGCGLSEIIIPDSVEIIGKQAFANCSSLAEIEIGDGVTSIGENAFANCFDIKSIVIGNGVTSLDHWSFGNKLESVEMGEGITDIGENVFLNCSNLKNAVIGKNVQSIGKNAFYGCTALKTIFIPDSVETIDVQAFLNCTGLEKVSLGKNLESIGQNAFRGCSNLKYIRMCYNVKNIGYAAFYDTSIEKVDYTGNESDWNGITFDSFNTKLTNAERKYVPNSAMEIDGNSLKVSCKNIPETGYDLFICSYAGGRIKDSYIRTVKTITGEVFTLGNDVDTVKVFILGSNGSFKPLTVGEILEV